MEEKLALNFVFHKWAFGCCHSQTFGLVIRCVLAMKLQTFAFEVSQLHSIKLLLWNLLSQKPLSWLYLSTLACMPAFLFLQNLWSFAAGSCFRTKSWSAPVLQLMGVLLWTVPCVCPCGYRASDGVYSAPAFTCTTGDTQNWGGDATNSFDGSCSGLSRGSNPSASSGYCPPQSLSEPEQQWLQPVYWAAAPQDNWDLRGPQESWVWPTCVQSRLSPLSHGGWRPSKQGDDTISLCPTVHTGKKLSPLSSLSGPARSLHKACGLLLRPRIEVVKRTHHWETLQDPMGHQPPGRCLPVATTSEPDCPTTGTPTAGPIT